MPKKEKKNHVSLIGSVRTILLRPLKSFCDEYFSEIKENITTEKTGMEFYSCDHTIVFLSFWNFDLICHMSNFN